MTNFFFRMPFILSKLWSNVPIICATSFCGLHKRFMAEVVDSLYPLTIYAMIKFDDLILFGPKKPYRLHSISRSSKFDMSFRMFWAFLICRIADLAPKATGVENVHRFSRFRFGKWELGYIVVAKMTCLLSYFFLTASMLITNISDFYTVAWPIVGLFQYSERTIKRNHRVYLEASPFITAPIWFCIVHIISSHL